jgi:50S ribosomal protein L16 3-hydroxylase
MIAQCLMDLASPTPLLGGLSPDGFMRRHWQKRPLAIPAAVPEARGLVERATLFRLAARDDVESRLVLRDGARWSVRQGPIARRALPAATAAPWTLLVQGVDLHLDAAHRLLGRFRFVPDARLDDVMVSYATDGGGVGPHVDSYDVFLLQLHGRRRWRIGKVGRKAALRPDVPLKILADFRPSAEWLLDPGDMLYLPPGWGHDGVAEGEAITASIGFRASGAARLGLDVAQHLLDGIELPDGEALYADPDQAATREPGRIPGSLRDFAQAAVSRLLADRGALDRALGETLSEPKPGVWFEAAAAPARLAGVRLDRRTRMLYDERHVYVNGDAFRMGGRDARLIRRLADRRALDRGEVDALSDEARGRVGAWLEAGWLIDAEDASPREEER